MFSLQVIDTDRFMDLPTSSQALYFHLGMHGDDDGFVASPRKIVRSVGCKDDDLKLLAAKGFVILFDSGVLVITDWQLNNTLRNDRYRQTLYSEEKALLALDNEKRYALRQPDWNQIASSPETEQNSTEPNSAEGNGAKIIIAGEKGSSCFVPPTLEAVRVFCEDNDYSFSPDKFYDYYAAKGWRLGEVEMADWTAAARGWERKEREKSGTGKDEFGQNWPAVGTTV